MLYLQETYDMILCDFFSCFIVYKKNTRIIVICSIRLQEIAVVGTLHFNPFRGKITPEFLAGHGPGHVSFPYSNYLSTPMYRVGDMLPISQSLVTTVNTTL